MISELFAGLCRLLMNILEVVQIWPPALHSGFRLWRAADDGDCATVARLLEDPAVDVNFRDGEWQNTPFCRACLQGYTDVVKLFLADPRTRLDIPNRLGESPFFISCESNHLELVRLLLDDHRGMVDIQKPDFDGATPLWIAANDGHLEVIKLLLATGREVGVARRTLPGPSSWSNCTAEDRARHTLHPEIAALLRAFTADPLPVSARLRREVGLGERWAAQTFAQVVLLCDAYLALSDQERGDNPEPRLRFYCIARALPMELQMMLCIRLNLGSTSFISVRSAEDALRRIVMLIG